jgi:hypothetical protein
MTVAQGRSGVRVMRCRGNRVLDLDCSAGGRHCGHKQRRNVVCPEYEPTRRCDGAATTRCSQPAARARSSERRAATRETEQLRE